MDSTGFLNFLSSREVVEKPEIQRVLADEDKINQTIVNSSENSIPETVSIVEPEITIDIPKSEEIVTKVDNGVAEKTNSLSL